MLFLAPVDVRMRVLGALAREDGSESMQAQDLVKRVSALDPSLGRDLQNYLGTRRLGLVWEESKPEYVRLWNKPVIEGDLVNILPPRGEAENLIDDGDEHDTIWRVAKITDGTARLVSFEGNTMCDASMDDLVSVARFDQRIYCGLKETGRVERGGDKPYQTIIDGENFHAIESLLFAYRGKVDCIYIDPPYNTGAKDWKYNNNYVGSDDRYRHSKWLTFMEDRLKIAKALLNPENSVLICTIDEKEYLRLGLLLDKLFPEASSQMVSINNNPAAVSRHGEFGRCDEYVFFLSFGCCRPVPYDLAPDWITTRGRTHTGHIRWDLLRRSGTRTQRSDSPGCFYPIYAKNGIIQSIGDAIPLNMDWHDVPVPDGLDAIWPIRRNGTEGNWQLSPKNLRTLWKNGFVKLGKKKGSSATVYYLKPGERSKIDNGVYSIVGYDIDGSAITSDAASIINQSLPTTQWKIISHDATQYGTRLLEKFFDGEKRFTYPKSLFAVEDCLRFYLANKPNAIVVDFFAGSGTTAHALMRLNHQDGGRRISISITNNEVSADEANKLSKRGLRPGDSSWEELGICKYVTVPRLTAAITGITPKGNRISGSYQVSSDVYVKNEYEVVQRNGKKTKKTLFALSKDVPNDVVPDVFPTADGFEENAVYYDLTYLEPSVVSADLAFDEIAPLLWLRAGSVGPIIKHSDTYELTDAYGVLFDTDYAASFIRACEERHVPLVYVVTDVDADYRALNRDLPGVEVLQLYKHYLRSFEIGAGL